MIELGPATEHEMILAFLRAEVDASRYRDVVNQCLNVVGYTSVDLIQNGDVSNEQQNRVRKQILQLYRGYGQNQYLFTGFPPDAIWQRAELEPNELDRLVYANEPSWVDLSDKTRTPRRLVANLLANRIPSDTANRIRAIQLALDRGETFPELIAAEGPADKIILIEGHSRATAYVASGIEIRIKLFLASSPSMRLWRYY